MPSNSIATVLRFLMESNAIEYVDDAQSLLDAYNAWEYLQEVSTLSVMSVCATHSILMRNQSLDAKYRGQFRDCPVWIGGIEAPDYRLIPNAIESWCKDANTSVAIPGKDGKHIKLDHITYEQIHPFVDGNGRTGRLFYNWARVKAGLPIHVIEAATKHKEYYTWFVVDTPKTLRGDITADEIYEKRAQEFQNYEIKAEQEREREASKNNS